MRFLLFVVFLMPSVCCGQALHDIVTKDSTDRSVTIYIFDATSGLPETAVAHDETGIDLWYRREGAAQTSITEAALAALTTAHTDGGLEPIGDGYYRLDLPDAAFATGAEHVDFGGAITDMVVKGGRVRLVDFDLETATVDVASISGSTTAADNLETAADTNYSATRGLAGTALPAVAAGANGGLPLGDANGRVDVSEWLGTAVATPNTAGVPITDASYFDGDTDVGPFIAASVWNTTQATYVGAGTFGEIATEIASILADTNELQTDDTPAAISALNNLSAAQVNSEVDTALADIHLDHLLAADYDPASKPGTSTALLNELVEDDSGVSRYTVNALENGPSGSGASASAIVDEWESQSQADPTGFHVNVIEVGGTAQTANDNGADINTLVTGVNVTSVSGSTTAADNAEVVFDTDFATAYDATLNMWNVDIEATNGNTTLDGESISDVFLYLGAVFMGDRAIVDNGSTQTTTYDGMDGTSGRVISTVNETTKARTIDTLDGSSP